MKKKIVLLLIIFGGMTGCTNVNQSDYSALIDEVTGSTLALVNQVSSGYRYYLPRGVTVKEDHDFNQQFSLLDTYLYMYVDVVSYYYKNELNYDDEKNYNYYYREIVNGDKVGYLAITEENDKYFVKIVYNYAKCEVYTSKENLASIITYSMMMLDSITYNDVLIEKIINDTSISTSEITYEIDKPSDSTSKFSQYLSEYVQEEDTSNSVLPDEYKSE